MIRPIVELSFTLIQKKWPLFNYCSYSVLLFILFSIAACQSKDTKQKNPDQTAIPIYQLPPPGALSKNETERIRDACELWYDSALGPKGFNGGILVAKNGHIIFEKYNGTGHLPGKDTITENTPMQIASTTKTFTAMAVLKLMQDGKLNIDDEYRQYFPAFNYPGVTIRNLLNHRSGLPNYTYFFENLGWDKSKIASNEDVLNFLITRKAEFENIAAPGMHFSYCNTNYALLALLIEKVTGKKYSDYLQRIFFNPLQMKNTFVFNLKDSNTVLPSYDWKQRPMLFGFLDAVVGDKNIFTTPRDLLLWDRALNSGLLFLPETLEQAYAPYSNEKQGVRNYGLGWRMNIYPDGKKIIYHNGWWHGSNCSFIRLLEDTVTIIVIGNKFTRAIYHAKILLNLFGDYYNTEEEEEADSQKIPDNITTLKAASGTQQPSAKFKEEKLQQLFKDKNPVDTKKRNR